jgi:clan AA aspartic protease
VISGSVDDYGRALIKLAVRNPLTGVAAERDAWIDTAFTGELLLPEELVAALSLSRIGSVDAGLSDGSHRLLIAYRCEVDWFGTAKVVDAVASPNRMVLLGVQLLENHELTINYPRRTVTVQ